MKLRRRKISGLRLCLLMPLGLGVAGILPAATAGEQRVVVTPVQLPKLPLGLVTLPNGRAMNLSVSAGAGAFRHPGDPEGRIWAVTDRGPALDCTEEKEIFPDDKLVCQPDRRGKIYPLPGYAPSIYSIDITSENTARYSTMLPLRSRTGKPVSGLATPQTNGRGEISYSFDGRQLDADPSGLEPGGIVRLSDGTFWLCDEFGPSLVEIGADGTVLRRIVPTGLGTDLSGADYAIEEKLPAILSLKQATRGFDGLAISPDETHLYVAVQNALANPDMETYRKSAAVRLLKIERATGTILGQYLYPLDPPESFPTDRSVYTRELRQSDVRVSELVAVGPDELLVLERIRTGSRIHRIDLARATPIPERFDAPEVRPSLEQLSREDWAGAGLVPLAKTLILDSTSVSGLGARLSGMAVLSPRQMILISNNDAGIDGSRSQMFRLTFPTAVLK